MPIRTPGEAVRIPVKRILLLAVAATICGCQMYGTTGTMKGAGYTGGSTAGVSISNYAFSPSTMSFPAASNVVVTWTNYDYVNHHVVSDAGDPSSFDSGVLGYGTMYSVGPLAAGTYSYHCAIHPTMTGSFTVN